MTTPSYASPLAMQAFLRTKNPLFPHIAQVYFDACEIASLNALQVFCHAIACTNYLRDSRAAKNDFFNSSLNPQTVFDGVAAHVDHILQIGGIENLPAQEREAMSVTENRFNDFANVNPPRTPPLDALKPKPEQPKKPEEPIQKPAWKIKLAVLLGILAPIAGIVGYFLPGPVRTLIKLVIEALRAVVQ